MTDIVERLLVQRDHADDWRTLLCEEAAEEIERLRAKHEELGIGWQRTYDHDVGLLKAEIEALRTQRDTYAREITGTLLPANDRLRAEIERLRMLIEVLEQMR
jgi:hypothetical protein